MALSREHVLSAAGCLSAAIAILHIVIIFLGPPAYRYFGAGEDMARQAEAGSFLPAAMTLAVTVVFTAFALYAFAGAGQLRRLPLLRTGLIAIAAIYLLRGLALFPDLAQYAQSSSTVMPRQLAFSLVSLTVGLLYLAGTVLLWPRLRPVRERTEILLSILLLCLLASGAAAQESPTARNTAPVPVGEPQKTLRLADGVEMAYVERGAGEPSLVFVHCGNCRKEIWRETLDAFAGTHRVVAMDLPGYGSSGANRERFTIESYGADVAALVDHLKLSRVILVGNSLGGSIVLEAAKRLGRERVLAVVAVDTLQNVESEWPEEDWRRRLDAYRKDFRSACDDMMLSLLPKDAPASARERIDRETCDNDPRAAISLFETLRTYDQADAIRAAGVPVWAINSKLFPTDVDANRKHALSFEAILMDGVGHYPQVERPEELQRHLRRVIEAVATPAAAPADGTLVEQTPCPPDTATYEQYVENAKGFYAREVEAATQEGIRIKTPADPTQGLLSKGDFERQRAYEGFECRRIKYLSDNLKVVGFLWKPKDTDGKKLPLIIYNRGGNREFGKLTPWMLRGFYSYVSNGFVVLASQYRGNDGGEGSEEFGGADVRDVLNLIPLARSLGYVDMNNVFLLGWSRGGMMTALALKNGIAVNAAAIGGSPGDLVAATQKRPAFIEMWKEMMPGFDTRRDEVLRERSAIYWADKINVPLLLLHGGADWRADPGETLALAQKLQELGKTYELIIYANDDHRLSANRADSTERTIEWFRRHMK